MSIKHLSFLMASLCLPIMLTACGGMSSSKNDVDENIRISRFEEKSRCGNEASYTINGKNYQVLDSAQGYKKKGMASWYGAEYQGSETASCEKFDMFAYTAAHRTLPLPSYVRVTNQKNGKSVIVRVNDRGPFDSSNEIELSFAAANTIGMVKSKMAPVTVEAITPDQLKGKVNVNKSTSTSLTPPSPATHAQQINYAKTPQARVQEVYYIIAGTFHNKNDAIDRFVRLSSIGIGKAEMATAFGDSRTLHLVRIGPLYNQDQIDNIKDRLEGDGLSRFKLVKETLK
jgi:rare lipoprotein A